MNIVMITPPYVDSVSMSVTDGLLQLGHRVIDGRGLGLNYMESKSNQVFDTNDESEELDLYIAADTHTADCTASEWMTKDMRLVKKIIIHGHDRWSGYENAPDCYVIPVDMSSWIAKAVFYRDWDGNHPIKMYDDRQRIFRGDFPIYPIDYAIERRYQETCNKHMKPYSKRENNVVFFGTLSTARRGYFLERLSSSVDKVVYDAYRFNTPDGKWSKHVYGRYTHDNDYYKELCNSKMVFAPMGAGSSCFRHMEAYASGAIPVIQSYPADIVTLHNFIDGENCILWSDEKELIEKVSYYLDNPAEGEELAAKAFKYGQENLTTKHLAEYILSKLEF